MSTKIKPKSTLEVLQWEIGGCREELPDGNKCWLPAEYVLWGKLIEPAGLGPRCYEHAVAHVGHRALAPDAMYALINLGDVARKIDEAAASSTTLRPHREGEDA